MNRLFRYLRGYCTLSVVGASPEWALNRLSEAKIPFELLDRPDSMTLRLIILQKDLKKASSAITKAMCEMTVQSKRSFLASIKGLWSRPVLTVGLLIAVTAAVFLPQRVWFYEVTGNTSVPTEQILRELRACGIGFGTYGPSIIPQQVKYKMLCRIPKLKWLTIRQKGARAVVVVRERGELEPINDRKLPQNVIASDTGIITRVECLEGNCLCAVGDCVRKGQLLVSAYLQLDRKTMVSSALAEIYAKTQHFLQMRLPDTIEKKTYGRNMTSYALIVGQNRLELSPSRGYCGKNCDKITEVKKFTLPGGLSLPIALEIVRICDYDTEERISAAKTAERQLCRRGRELIERQLIAGSVLTERYAFSHQKGCYSCEASLGCEEMIARRVRAAILEG